MKQPLVILFFSLAFTQVFANDHQDLNLIVPVDLLKITKDNKIVVDEKQMIKNDNVYYSKGELAEYLAEVKKNSNGTISSIVSATPQSQKYQALKFDGNGKLLYKADCSDTADKVNCNIIVPEFCSEFVKQAQVKNHRELEEKVKSCRKLSALFEKSKNYEARDKMKEALKSTQDSLQKGAMWATSKRESPLTESKFELNYTIDVELGLFDMVNMAEDCTRFAEQGLLPPNQQSSSEGKKAVR